MSADTSNLTSRISASAARPGRCAPTPRSAFEDVDLVGAARRALEQSLKAGVEVYDRRRALMRFHRLSPQTIESPHPDAARLILKEIEQALRRERARRGHWTYDLNRHIALMSAHRAESERLSRLLKSRAREATAKLFR